MISRTGGPSADYAGFNLVLFSPSGTAGEPLSYDGSTVTNSGGGGVITSRPLSSEERCVGGVSNGIDTLDGQTWPKVVQGRGTLTDLLNSKATRETEEEEEEELIEELFSLLRYVAMSPASYRCG